MKILITGTSGFIGGAVMRHLDTEGIHNAHASTVRLNTSADWSPDLNGVDAIIHCAARVHVMHDRAADPLAQYHAVNVDGTLALAQQAAAAGVKRFIFLSSIKVNGEKTQPNKPFTADDPPNPQDAYGISKQEAEAGLRAIAKTTGMEVVIIRPPLVYGPGVKGNLASLSKQVARGIPLPFGSIRNQRSFVALDNLVDLMVLCLTHPAAANQTFLVSDGTDLSTPELVRMIASSMRKPARLIPMPHVLFYLAARLLGRPDIVQRICGSLQVDISKTTSLLGWCPPVTPKKAFQYLGKEI